MPRRIALVVNALTGDELSAGADDSARIFGVLVDGSLGDCDPGSAVLLRDCPRRRDFEDSLSDLLGDWQSKDQLILYFSGHGKDRNGRYSLVFGDKELTYYPFGSLLLELQSNGVTRAILILDSCYSGLALDEGRKSDVAPFRPELEQEIPRGVAIITSSRENEQSYEKRELGEGERPQSVFTELFCQAITTGLNNTVTSDDKIAVEDVVAFVNGQILHDEKYSRYPQNSVYGVDRGERRIWVAHNRTRSEQIEERSSADLQITSVEELRFAYERTATWRHPCDGATLQELDWGLVEQYGKVADPDLFQGEDRARIARKLQLFSPILVGEVEYLHRAAVLCFCKHPDRFFPQARAAFVRGDIGGVKYMSPSWVTGPLTRQISQLVKLALESLDRISSSGSDGLRREDEEVPQTVIRELISNAVIHRDYDSDGTVQVHVTSDFVEVRSPGRFPGNLSWGDLIERPRSYPSDKAIALYAIRLRGFEGISRGFSVFRRFLERNDGSGITCEVLDDPAVRVRVARATLTQLTSVQAGRDVVVVSGKTERTPPPSGDISRTSVNISRLPVPGPHFIGRDAELERLDQAWDDDTCVFVLTAFGGVGKSALVYKWVEALAEDDWRDAERVLGWSFYSQGTDATAASADAFVDFALRWLGNEEEVPGSPWERGVLLARLLRQRRTLLILDGLEPLQHPPGTQTGRLKDPALQALLREVAIKNNGLCVVTTRLTVADVAGRDGTVVVDLERLPSEAGATLLKQLGVEGSDDELRKASDEFGGHALALTLLGNYLTEALDGDVRQRGEVEILDEDVEQGAHARRVMASYASWLGDGPEVQVLRLVGLFDRPAQMDAVAALRKVPVVPGLTEGIGEDQEKSWRKALTRLRKAGLLTPDDGGGLDAHPLVRAFFGEALEAERSEAWRAGHERLYEHYRQAAPELPDTLDEMMPLYMAAVHGCRAGRPQEAADEVFYRRINRGDELYSLHKLGAFGAQLNALAAFFDRPWDRPSAGLTKLDQAWILNEAAFVLRALGRLPEAVQPMQTGLDSLVAVEDWMNAARSAGNLSELTLTLGDLTQAVAFAERSVELADRSGNSFQRMARRTTLADALHQAGRWEESAACFREAEEMQAEWQPHYPRLYSVRGYRYCDLLLSRPASVDALDLLPDADACRDVLERAHQSLAWMQNEGAPLLTVALDDLSLGRAHLGLAQASGDAATPNAGPAATHLDRAVDVLRQAGDEEYIGRGLLARAVLRRFRGDVDGASADVDEAGEIAERGHMRLFACDIHLERTRLAFVRGNAEEAGGHLAAAREIVEATGYRRRDREAEALEKVILTPTR